MMQRFAVQRNLSRTPTASSVINLGSVELVSISSERPEAAAQFADVSIQRPQHLVLVLMERGQISVMQNGRLCPLREGQYMLLECRQKVRISGSGDYKLMAMYMPAHLLRARLRNMPRIFQHALPCSELPWRLVSNLVRMLVSEIKYIPPQLTYTYANQVIEFVSVAVETDTQAMFGTHGRNAILKRCAAYVKSNISDCDLDPNRISDAMGISVRYLHKIFQESGESVCDFLRSTRLETAKVELADPHKLSTQIREVARRVGFRSQAHFAAAFKGRYGISATKWRKMACDGAEVDMSD